MFGENRKDFLSIYHQKTKVQNVYAIIIPVYDKKRYGGGLIYRIFKLIK